MSIRVFAATFVLLTAPALVIAQVPEPPQTMTAEQLTQAVIAVEDQLKKVGDAVANNTTYK